jgi:predicted site-specific integrase-resolvase
MFINLSKLEEGKSRMKKKEPRNVVLYAHVSKKNKKWLKDNYKNYGYATLSPMVDDLITEVRENNARKNKSKS